MKKILLPIDGSERSLKSISLVKELYQPDEVQLYILVVREDVDWMRTQQDFEEARNLMQPMLEGAVAQLAEYQAKTIVAFGRAGEEILYCAEQEGISTIVMTKSTRGGWYRAIGSVTAHVVKYAKCVVMIVPEAGIEQEVE